MRRIVLALLCTASAAIAAEPPKTVMTAPGKELLNDSLAKGFANGWKTAKGQWTAAEGGGVTGKELAADMHGAVARIDAKFTDGVIAVKFKLDGCKGTSLSLNGAKGHICRVAISPAKFSVNKDDQDGKNGPDKGAILGTCTTAVKPGEWHTLVVEFRGPEILATIDGQHTAYGKSEDIAKEKTNLGLTCAGETVSFKDLTILEGSQHPDWEKNRSKYAK